MFDRFTDDAKRAFSHARQAALRYRHEVIDTEHLLIGLVSVGGTAARVLHDIGLDLDQVKQDIERLVDTGPSQGRRAPPARRRTRGPLRTRPAGR